MIDYNRKLQATSKYFLLIFSVVNTLILDTLISDTSGNITRGAISDAYRMQRRWCTK